MVVVVDPGRVVDHRDRVAAIRLGREDVDLAERTEHRSSLPEATASGASAARCATLAGTNTEAGPIRPATRRNDTVAKVTMPQLGESVAEGTIGKWLKQPGDTVEKYEPLLEVITDKVNAEVPSPFAGVLKEILAAGRRDRPEQRRDRR